MELCTLAYKYLPKSLPSILLEICTLRSRNAGSYSISIFNLLRNYWTVSCCGCTILYSYQQCMRVPIFLHLHRYLLFSFKKNSHLGRCEVISYCGNLFLTKNHGNSIKERQHFQQMVLEQPDIHMQKEKEKKKNLDPNLTLCTNINSLWIADLNINIQL